VIPGIGPKSEASLHQRNIRTIKDLREIPDVILTDWFGKWGQRLFEKAQGIDVKRVDAKVTRRTGDLRRRYPQPAVVTERLYSMEERIIAKLREKEFTGFRTITLTMRFADFQTANRSRSLKSRGGSAFKAGSPELVLPSSMRGKIAGERRFASSACVSRSFSDPTTFSRSDD
jgi:nucleotidyltransferase/DNA polymerase involved in DNA repair